MNVLAEPSLLRFGFRTWINMALRTGPPRRKRPRAVSTVAVGVQPLESALAGEIRRALEMVGYDVSSTQQQRASRQAVGLPDYFVSHAAFRVFAWLEVKTESGRVTPGQREWHERTRAAGCPVLVVRSAWDAITQLNGLRGKR